MYVDTSALLKLVVQEAESDLLAEQLDEVSEDLVTSELVLAELHRNAGKHGVEESATEAVLGQLALMGVTTELLRRAGRLPSTAGFLRTADALHLVTAMATGEASFCSYDRRQAQAAASAGFGIVAPGMPAGWPIP